MVNLFSTRLDREHLCYTCSQAPIPEDLLWLKTRHLPSAPGSLPWSLPIRRLLHPQHVVDRFLDGYGWNGTFHHPAMDVVSLYVDQRGEGDLSQDRADRHPTMKIYPTIAEALTLGTGKLAVDGVVVVGEHGNYPLTEKGIMKHPHFEFFEAGHQGVPRQRPVGPLLQRQRALVEVGLVRSRWSTPPTSWAFRSRAVRAWR